MSYNGAGVFSITTAGQPVVTGTVISSTAFNALTADLATGLSTAITKDGQTTTTARILFAQGISSTLVTDATSATTGSIITAGGISTQKALWVGTTSRLVGNVQADGNLGIGTTPSTLLHLYSADPELRIQGSASSSVHYSTLTFLNAAGSTLGSIGLSYYGGAAEFVYNSATSWAQVWKINSVEKARLDTSGNLLVGTTVVAGSMSNTACITAGAAKTYDSSATITAGVATTIATVSTSGLYICHAYVSGFNPGLADWSNYAIISQTQGSGTAKTLVTGSNVNVVFTMSGNNIQITSGATVNYTWAILRIA